MASVLMLGGLVIPITSSQSASAAVGDVDSYLIGNGSLNTNGAMTAASDTYTKKYDFLSTSTKYK